VFPSTINIFFTCNHGSENHCYGDKVSLRKKAPEVVVNGAAPPDHLKEEKWDGHAHQSAVLYYQPLVPGRIRIERGQGLSLSGRQGLT